MNISQEEIEKYVIGHKLDNMTKKELIEYIVKQAQIITSQEKRNEILSKELTKDLPINQSKLSTCCGIPIEEIPELVNKVEILQRENTRLGKTAYRKGRIIDELEKWLEELSYDALKGGYYRNTLNKLKKLKNCTKESQNDAIKSNDEAIKGSDKE